MSQVVAFLSNYRINMIHKSWCDIIKYIDEMSKKESSNQSRVVAIISGVLFLLEQFPQKKIYELDIDGGLRGLISSIDIPYSDEKREIYEGFKSHSCSFIKTSLDKDVVNNWHKNTDYIMEHVSCEVSFKKKKVDIFVLYNGLSFLISDKVVVIDGSLINFFEKLFFKDLATMSVEERYYVLYEAKNMACIKLFELLKVKLDAPWIPVDDKLHSRIRSFRQYYSKSEKYDYLMARFYEKKGDLNRAEKYANIGLKRRRLDYNLCELMGDIALKKGNYVTAAEYYGRMLAKNASGSLKWMTLNSHELNADDRAKARIDRLLLLAGENSEESLNDCIEAFGKVLITDRVRFGGRKKFVYKDKKFFIVDLDDKEKYGIKSGNEMFYIGNNSCGMPQIEYCRGRKCKKFEVSFDEKYVLPLMITTDNTELIIVYKDKKVKYDTDSVSRFKVNNWVYLRLQGEIKVCSQNEFVIGKPFVLNKSDGKRKIVVNLLVDAMSMEEIQHDLKKYMPNTYDFFSKGTMFRYAYGVSDWTQPCTSSMFYGIELYRHQLFNSRINLKQSIEYKNVAEELRDKGYFCLNYTGDVPRMLANDAYRGYDMHRTMGESELSIIDAMHFLQNSPSKVFLNMHFMDVHDAYFLPLGYLTSSVYTLDIDYENLMKNDMFVKGNKNLTVEEQREGRMAVYLHQIREMDRKLNMLFEFLNKNYSDDEYMVVLCSDHGVMKFDFSTSRHHMHTCLMVRGGGVPNKGIVENEVVSAMDWFSIYEHFCGFKSKRSRDSVLPKAFGGPGRKYAVSQRLYPGQTYSIALNDLEYEFHITSKISTSYDGKVDLRYLEHHLYKNKNDVRKEVFDQDLIDMYTSLAYEHIKYIDEPKDYSVDNPLSDMLVERTQRYRPLISLVIDARSEIDFVHVVQYIREASFRNLELVVLVNSNRNDSLITNYGDMLEEIIVKELPVRYRFKIKDILENICGEYVLFLDGYDVLGSKALEAFYYTAEKLKCEVVENAYNLENEDNMEVFPEDVYQKVMQPLDGSNFIWQPVNIEGRISTRYNYLLNLDKRRVHIGDYFVRKDFLMNFEDMVVSMYGFESILLLHLLFFANKYVKISVPICMHAKNKSQVQPEACIDDLLKGMVQVEILLKKIPYLADKLQWQDGIRLKFFKIFEERYLKQINQSDIEHVIAKVLKKYSTVSSWLVRYIFSRGLKIKS